MMIVLITSRVGASAAQAVLLLALARAIAPDIFGEVSAIVGLGSFVAGVVTLGFPSLILRRRELPSRDPLAYLGLVATIVTSSVAVALVALIALSDPFERVGFIPLLLLATWVGLERVGEYQISILVSGGLERRVALVLSVRRILPLVVFFTLTANSVEPILAFALALTSCSALGNFVGHFIAPLPARERVTAHKIRELVRLALPFWFSSTATQARDAEPFLFQLVYDSMVAGLYSVVYRFEKPVRIIAQAASQSLTPAATRGDREFSRRALDRILIIGVLVTVSGLILIPFVPHLIVGLLGEEYSGATALVQIICGAVGIMSISRPLGSICQAAGAERMVAVVGWLAVIVVCLAVATIAFIGLSSFWAVLSLATVYAVKSLVFYLMGKRMLRRQ